MTRTALSLRARLFLMILAPLILVAILLGFWRIETARATAEDLFDRGLLAAALAISRDVAISEGDALSPRTRGLISDAGGGELFYHVTGPGGIYVTGYAYPPRQSEPRAGDGPHYFRALYRGEAVRVLRMSETTTIGNLTGETVVTAWQRISDRNAFAAALARRAVALMAALIATLAIVVWFGVQFGLRPLRDLQDAIEQRSPDDLSRIRRPVPAEVTGIVATLNRLLGQVDHSIQTHQAFISDAAHQLRNPAGAILSLAETLPDVTDPEARRQREQELISASRKSARLAGQLLHLERLHYGNTATPEPFDLNAVVEEVSADLAPAVLGQDIAFSFDRSPEPLPVCGDATLIGEAVRNLIDNALRHGGPGLGRIAIRTLRQEDRALVEVTDDGHGLSPDNSEIAFRRFGQVEPGEGSGLGLSIVQSVATLHDGEVEVGDVPNGALLRLRLPLTAGAPATGGGSA